MDLATFFRTVVTSPGHGWFCLGYAKITASDEKATKESWAEEFFSWPDEVSRIINRVHELKEDYDVYFSPYLFSEQSSKKEFAIVGQTIVADLDEANVLTLPLEPSVLVETSLGRHQGYWILRDALDEVEHEALSKRLTYSIPRCDRTGWFKGKKVRVPETYNNKYVTGKQYIRVVRDSAKKYRNAEFEQIPSIRELYGTHEIKEIDDSDFTWAENALKQDIGPQEMLSRVRRSIPTVIARYNTLMKDRSAALWHLNLSLFRAGMSREHVFYIAYHSVNNKFKELRYGGIKELAKDVLRAEQAYKIQIPDVKAQIREARKLTDDVMDKNEFLSKIVREHLEKLGSFVHCDDDSYWYIRDDTGCPIYIAHRSEKLIHLLNVVFGINASDKESSFITHDLQAMVADLPVTGKVSNLSLYDHELRTFILHTGRKDVLVVNADGIRRENNGYQGYIFPWRLGNNAISPHYQALDNRWEDELFDSCLDNLLDVRKDAAKAVLKVWFLSILLRDGLNSRPILALFGQPGSGKSTLFRRVYALLYGREKGLNSVTREEDFDYAMASDPLVVLDNVDTYARWLPDRMAATVAPTEVTKRKLFTDTDTVILRRNAMLGITAHNPKFGREDVTDRFLLFTFERLANFKPENVILDRIVSLRNGLWGAILSDIQTVLGTNFPRTGFTQFRIEDFAHFGYWIASSLGIEQQFNEGLDSIKKEQKNFNLEEDTILLHAITRMLANERIDMLGAGQLWPKLKRYSGDERGFDKRYQNSVSLARKLWTLLDSLREVFDVSWSTKNGVRVWTINKLEEDIINEGNKNGSAVGSSSGLFGTND